jgi:hypothetical protein
MEPIVRGGLQLVFGLLLGALTVKHIAIWVPSLCRAALAPASSFARRCLSVLRAVFLSWGLYALALVSLMAFRSWTIEPYGSLFITGLFVVVGLFGAHRIRSARSKSAA